MGVTTVNHKMDLASRPATATRVAVILEYDGTRYHGFQLQAGVPTIQGAIEAALEKLTGERIRVIAASRTDAGVHARGQVVSFRTKSSHSPETFVNALNYYLPWDIAVKMAYRVSDSFRVRRDAVSREYSYYILNSPTRSPLSEGFSCYVGQPLDIAAINRICPALLGKHDFASFTSADGARLRSTVRTVYRAEMRREGELAVFSMVANSFLPHQVRTTIGTLLRVGLGRMSPEEFYSIIEARTPGRAGPTAPASGLCLMRVNYAHPFGEDS